jgi:uncharacterized protein YuzE
MKVIYDKETDTLVIRLRDGNYSESDEVQPGVVFDYDQDHCLLSIEILYASRQKLDLDSLGLELAGQKSQV